MRVSLQILPLPQSNRTAGFFSCHRQLLPLPQRNQTTGIFFRHRHLLPLPQWNKTAGIFPVNGNCTLSSNEIGQQGFYLVIGNCPLSHNQHAESRTGSFLSSRQTQIWNRISGIFFPSSPTVPSPSDSFYINLSVCAWELIGLFTVTGRGTAHVNRLSRPIQHQSWLTQFRQLNVFWCHIKCGFKRSRLNNVNLCQQFRWLRDDAWHRMGETFYNCQLLSGEYNILATNTRVL